MTSQTAITTESMLMTGTPSGELESSWEAIAYVVLTAIMSVLSMVGCVVITVIFIKFKEMRSTAMRILMYLTLADFLTAFGNGLGIMWIFLQQFDEEQWPGKLFYCRFHSGLTIFSSIAMYLWSVASVIYLYVCLVHNKHTLAEKLMLPFHIVSWGVPMVVVSVSRGLDVIGTDLRTKHVSWCWIKNEVDYLTVLFWQYFTGKIWEIICILLTFIFYIQIKCFLSRQVAQSKYLFQTADKASIRRNKGLNKANLKMTFIPIVFLVCRIWGTLRFLLGAYAPEYANSPGAAWIVPLQGVGDSAQGFANALIFCIFTPRVNKHFNCCHCCPNSPAREEEGEQSSVRGEVTDQHNSAKENKTNAESGKKVSNGQENEDVAITKPQDQDTIHDEANVGGINPGFEL